MVLVPWWLVQPGQEWKQSMWHQGDRSGAAIPLEWADLQEERVIQCPLAMSPQGQGAQPTQPSPPCRSYPPRRTAAQLRSQVWGGACIYKYTAVPSPRHAQVQVPRVQVGCLGPLAQARCSPGGGPGLSAKISP